MISTNKRDRGRHALPFLQYDQRPMTAIAQVFPRLDQGPMSRSADFDTFSLGGRLDRSTVDGVGGNHSDSNSGIAARALLDKRGHRGADDARAREGRLRRDPSRPRQRRRVRLDHRPPLVPAKEAEALEFLKTIMNLYAG
jgi:hypothetical protein